MTILHAGVTKRIILLISRIELSRYATQQPIPTPAGKQFVVGKSDQTISEGFSRALFWYREELIGGLLRRGRVVIRWSCSNNRSGILSFRNLVLKPSYLAIIKTDPIKIEANILGTDDEKTRINELTTIEWKITNLKGII